jgi:hypothetical protein
MKDEALKLALDDLIAEYHMETSSFAKRVDEIFKQALAAQPAPVQEPVALIDRLINPEDHYEFTDPKKANAVLMSLCQEAADALAAPAQEPVAWMFDCGNGGRMYAEDLDASVGWLPLYTTPPAAIVQEPVNQRAHEMALRQWESWKQYALELQEKLVKYEGGAPMVLNTTPPAAQPAVPDAMTSADIQEHIEYVAGWNDCRAEMLKGMK